MELKIEENDGDAFVINEKIASEHSIEEDDVLLGKNTINQKAIAGHAETCDDIDKEKIGIPREKFESIGLDCDFKIEIQKYNDDLVSVKEVDFGFVDRSSSSEDPLSTVKENEKEFLNFIKEKVFTKNSKFFWDTHQLLVSIKSTYPKLGVDQVGVFTDIEECNYVWGGGELKSFDGILMIDMSGSMETKDLKMEDIEWVVERINSGIQGKMTSGFLRNLKDRMKIKRSEGAAFCALMYLVQKIGRGVGDNISIVPFSKEAKPIRFKDQKFFSSKIGSTREAAENIIETINYFPRGQTNISGALDQTIEVMKEFNRDKMKMVVILTDGEPNPSSIDDRDSVKKLVNERIAPRSDVIINTIGLGDEVDHHLLEEIASVTGGEYTYVNSLEGLTQAYSNYATSISIKGTVLPG